MWLPFLLPIFVFCAVMVSMIAKNKGRNPFIWFFLGVVVGPAAFAVAFLPSLAIKEPAQPKPLFPLNEAGQISLENETRLCPACSEQIKIEALKCNLCGAIFDPVQVEQLASDCRAEINSKLEQGLKRCPTCMKWDVHEAFVEDGSWDDWCPNCKKSLKAMGNR